MVIAPEAGLPAAVFGLAGLLMLALLLVNRLHAGRDARHGMLRRKSEAGSQSCEPASCVAELLRGRG